MIGDANKQKPSYIPAPLRPRRLAWTLTIAALLGVVSAFFFYPLFQLWQARQDLTSGETDRIVHGLTALGEIALQNQSISGQTAKVFADLMADDSLSLGVHLRNLAQEVSRKNPRLVKAWAASLDATAADDSRFLALRKLITAAGKWDEQPLRHRLRADLLRVLQAVPDQRGDALTTFLEFNPVEVRNDAYWPTLAKHLALLTNPPEPPDVRASALTLLTRFVGRLPASLRERPLPAEAEMAYEIGLLLLTGPLDEPEQWRQWLTTSLVTWTPVLPPLRSAPASTSQPAPLSGDTGSEPRLTTQSAPAREKHAASVPASAGSQPVTTQPGEIFEEMVRTVLRMAQGSLSAGADLPPAEKVLTLPLGERRAIAAGLRYAEPKLLARYAEVLLNDKDQDAIVQARVCLAFLYQPSPAARTPLLQIATRGVNEPALSDEAWVAAHPLRVAALAALAVNRDPVKDDPVLLEFLWQLCAREIFGNEEIEEAICTLRTLSVHPAPVTTRADFARFRTLAFSDQVLAWQLKREIARTWLVRSRLPSTQPAENALSSGEGGTNTGSQPATQPKGKGNQVRLQAAATPQDAYLAILREMDYYEPQDGPPANAPAQYGRLLAMFDAWQLGIFSSQQLGNLTRSLSISERGSAALLAGLEREKPLAPVLMQRQKLEPDPLVRVYLKIALGLLADPVNVAPLEDAYFSIDIPRPFLYWADFSAGSRLPLNRLFMQQESPRTLLQINRFEEVVQAYFPSLPNVPLAADYNLRKVGFSLQKRWWVVRVPRLQYDPGEQIWREPPKGSSSSLPASRPVGE